MRRNLMTITVTDTQGSKSFVTKKGIKKKIAIVCSLVTLYCIGSTSIALYFSDEHRKTAAIKKQNKELALYKKNIQEEQAKNEIRFDLANINKTSMAKKIAFLTVIPSGDPLVDKKSVVTSDFGNRTHPILGERLNHNGIDIRAPIGTPVQATANGYISFSGTQNGYGNVVKIEHAYGFQTTFAHLDELLIKEGQFVKKGTVVAKSGNTGRSTGPHLHYEVRFRGTPLNSINFMLWDQEHFDYLFTNQKDIQWAFFVNEII